MKIALIGYGKMGRAIDLLAQADGHSVILRINSHNQEELTTAALQKADVAIEFSRPEAARANIEACLQAGVPIVVGTTAWLDQLDEVKKRCAICEGALFYASNFSIGVNIFFAVNRYLAQLMAPQTDYEVKLREIHHTQKLDAPSGTAITLAESILQALPRKNQWVNQPSQVSENLEIISERIDPTPGTHEVTYSSPIDTITIHHEAHSREGFARGALQAAAWLVGKKGVFTMQDMLGF
ncbi:MAG: 4-hydroxy-tetrahydrodipicolinate reductase [Lewinellaceae bacterium]|nr:4-hydroxy-tetrahydrodipicolinate reductase [Lewinellaceae bacterium]